MIPSPAEIWIRRFLAVARISFSLASRSAFVVAILLHPVFRGTVVSEAVFAVRLRHNRYPNPTSTLLVVFVDQAYVCDRVVAEVNVLAVDMDRTAGHRIAMECEQEFRARRRDLLNTVHVVVDLGHIHRLGDGPLE